MRLNCSFRIQHSMKRYWAQQEHQLVMSMSYATNFSEPIKGCGAWPTPPCKDCLHMPQSQLSIWSMTSESRQVPSRGYWWEISGKLAINWMTGSPAPGVDILSWKCMCVCQAPHCECLVNGLKCTELCCLQDYSNVRTKKDEQQQKKSSDDEV